MPYFKVARDEQGNRVMESQELEPDKPRRARGVPAHLLVDQASPALQQLVTGLHEENAEWAIERVERLEDEDEIRKIYSLEAAHPQHEGGRKAVIKAIKARRQELGFGQPEEGDEELEEWTLKTSPAEYLERYGPDAKNSALAQAHLDRDPPPEEVEDVEAEIASITEGSDEKLERVSDALPCDECDFVAASETGLTNHIESQHPDAG